MSQRPRLAPAALKLLAAGFTGTQEEIAARVFGHPTAVRRSLNALHAEKRIRVFDWTKNHQRWTPVWAVADGQPDEPKPRPKTKAEVARTYKAKRPDRFARRAMVRSWLQERSA